MLDKIVERNIPNYIHETDKNQKYFYKVYGQVVESDFEMDELQVTECSGEPDIMVCLEKVPERFSSAEDKETKVYIENGEVGFFVKDVGSYFLSGGNRISIECLDNCNIYNRKVFTLGSAMGILLIIKGKIPIHGGTVACNGKALIVTGESGAGKSTISVALKMSGMEFVADDVSVLDYDEKQKVMVQPAYPQQKLCRDAALHLGYHLDELIYIDESRDKFAVRLKEHFLISPVPLAVMVELCIGKEEQEKDLVIQKLTGHEKLFVFLRNIYRGFIYRRLGMEPEVMKQCLSILQSLPVYRIYRRPGTDTVWDTVNWLKGLEELQ